MKRLANVTDYSESGGAHMLDFSNNLFMISLFLLILSFIVNGMGRRGMTNHDNLSNPSGNITDLQMEHDHKKVIETQNSLLARVLRSYLFWIAILGMVVSIIISKL